MTDRQHHLSQIIDQPNRTWLCSIVFMDIVSYTVHPLARQIALKNRFSAIVQAVAHAHFDESDLFVVDAGDGGALCYLGDPEDMLFCARDLMEEFRKEKDPALPVRIGINLGPVKLHTNVAGQPNPIGDGINVAQRVMSFAGAGEVLVSRSFYEVVGCLAEEYSCLFEHIGERADKHVRKHDLYRVRGADEQARRPVLAVVDRKPEPAAPAPEPVSSPMPASPCILQKEMEKMVVGYLGPVGKVLVRRIFRRAESGEAAIEELAGHIPTAGERRQFTARAETLLLKMHDQFPKRRTEAAASAGTSTHHWSEAELDAAGDHLLQYIGPMARVLVKRSAGQCRDLGTLYQALARFIPNERQQARFLQEAGVGAE